MFLSGRVFLSRGGRQNGLEQTAYARRGGRLLGRGLRTPVRWLVLVLRVALCVTLRVALWLVLRMRLRARGLLVAGLVRLGVRLVRVDVRGVAGERQGLVVPRLLPALLLLLGLLRVGRRLGLGMRLR